MNDFFAMILGPMSMHTSKNTQPCGRVALLAYRRGLPLEDAVTANAVVDSSSSYYAPRSSRCTVQHVCTPDALCAPAPPPHRWAVCCACCVALHDITRGSSKPSFFACFISWAEILILGRGTLWVVLSA